MSVDAHVASGSGQTFVLSKRYVFASFRIDVLFGQTKVDHVNDVHFLRTNPADKEIFRFNVAVD